MIFKPLVRLVVLVCHLFKFKASKIGIIYLYSTNLMDISEGLIENNYFYFIIY